MRTTPRMVWAALIGWAAGLAGLGVSLAWLLNSGLTIPQPFAAGILDDPEAVHAALGSYDGVNQSMLLARGLSIALAAVCVAVIAASTVTVYRYLRGQGVLDGQTGPEFFTLAVCAPALALSLLLLPAYPVTAGATLAVQFALTLALVTVNLRVMWRSRYDLVGAWFSASARTTS